MPIEEVFVEDGVVVGQCLGKAGQPGGWDFLQGGLVGFVSNAAHIDDDAIIRVSQVEVHRCRLVVGGFTPLVPLVEVVPVAVAEEEKKAVLIVIEIVQ